MTQRLERTQSRKKKQGRRNLRGIKILYMITGAEVNAAESGLPLGEFYRVMSPDLSNAKNQAIIKTLADRLQLDGILPSSTTTWHWVAAFPHRRLGTGYQQRESPSGSTAV